MIRRLAVGVVLSASVLVVDHAHAKPKPKPSPKLLDCVAYWESEGHGTRAYRSTYHDPQGNRGGRYQFQRKTWNSLVKRMGRPTLAEQHPYHASSQDQDDAAGRLMSERGLEPWPTPKRRCRP